MKSPPSISQRWQWEAMGSSLLEGGLSIAAPELFCVSVFTQDIRGTRKGTRGVTETGIHCQLNHHFVGLNHHFAGLNQHLVRLNHHFVGLNGWTTTWATKNSSKSSTFAQRLRPGRLCLSQQFRFRGIWSLGHVFWWRRWNNAFKE